MVIPQAAGGLHIGPCHEGPGRVLGKDGGRIHELLVLEHQRDKLRKIAEGNNIPQRIFTVGRHRHAECHFLGRVDACIAGRHAGVGIGPGNAIGMVMVPHETRALVVRIEIIRLAGHHGFARNVVQNTAGSVQEARAARASRIPKIERSAVADPRNKAAVQVSCSPVFCNRLSGDRLNGGVIRDNALPGRQCIRKAYAGCRAAHGDDQAGEMPLDSCLRIPIPPQFRGTETRMEYVRKLAKRDLIQIGISEYGVRYGRSQRDADPAKAAERHGPLGQYRAGGHRTCCCPNVCSSEFPWHHEACPCYCAHA